MTGIKISLPLSMTAEDIVSIENAYNFYKKRKLILGSKGYDFLSDSTRKQQENYWEKSVKMAY